jgi:hypothetical protein
LLHHRAIRWYWANLQEFWCIHQITESFQDYSWIVFQIEDRQQQMVHNVSPATTTPMSHGAKRRVRTQDCISQPFSLLTLHPIELPSAKVWSFLYTEGRLVPSRDLAATSWNSP